MVQYSGHLQQIKEKQMSGKLDMSQDLTFLNTLHEDLHWALLATSKSQGKMKTCVELGCSSLS